LCAESRPYEIILSDRLAEFVSRGYKTAVISDNMIGFSLSKRKASLVFIYYHRINKEFAYCQGGSLLATVLAKELGTPCYLYPTDYTMPAGDNNHSLRFAGDNIVPKGVKSFIPQTEKVPLSYVSKSW